VGCGDGLLGELALSDEILKRVTETYRRIRNTVRFFAGEHIRFRRDERPRSLDAMSEMIVMRSR